MIPDVEEDPNEVNTKTVSQPPQMINKIQNLSELHQSDRQYMLPQTVRTYNLYKEIFCLNFPRMKTLIWEYSFQH